MPISPDLASAGAAIVGSLGGSWHKDRGMCRCPAHPDRSPSLSVRLGAQTLLFKCFAGCATIDVLRALRTRRLAVPVDASGAIVAVDPICSGLRSVARELWSSAGPISGTIAEHYLAHRGLGTARSLRFHPKTPFGRGRAVRFLPAIIGAVAEGSEIVAVQRLFLEPGGHQLLSGIGKPKRTLGRPLAGAVRLAPAGPVLGLAEGVETAMAAMILLGIPVWAALGSERLHQIAIPPVVERLVLLPDRDRAGRTAVDRSMSAYAGRPFGTETVWPWFDLNDWADVLMRQSGRGVEGAGAGVRRVA